jgi:AcrR family transcriptional regulator
VPQLDRQRIAQAALAVADREGPAGFTMRAIADELGVTSTALYRHMQDKRELISLVVDAVTTEQVFPEPTGEWREDLWLLARMMRQMMHAHPAVSELARGHQIFSTTVLPLTERWMTLWSQSGLPLDVALRAAVATSLAIAGIAQSELQAQSMQQPAESSLTWVPNARRAFRLERDPDADFELVVRSLVDGVHARLAAEIDHAPA